MKIYSITSFYKESAPDFRRLIGERLTVGWEDAENGEGQGEYSDHAEALAAFEHLGADAYISGRHVNFDFCILDEAEVADDDYDPQASLLDNLINGGEIISETLIRPVITITGFDARRDPIYSVETVTERRNNPI